MMCTIICQNRRHHDEQSPGHLLRRRNLPQEYERAHRREQGLETQNNIRFARRHLLLTRLLQQICHGSGSHGAVGEQRPHREGGPSGPEGGEGFDPRSGREEG